VKLRQCLRRYISRSDFWNSSWSLRPWLFSSVHGLAFKEVRISLNQDDIRATIAQHTDAGKVPLLQDGDLTVWDSLAICEYISEQYLDGGGWPLSVFGFRVLRAPR
jgi:glutathione S-transferase